MNMDKQGVPVQNQTIKRMLFTLLVLACVLAQAANGIETLPFTLSRPFLEQAPLQLDSADRQWLDERKVLRVGVASSDYEPIDITTDRNRYQGLSADYLSLVSAKLGVQMQITAFAEPDDMIRALLAGDVDVLTSTNGYERGTEGLAFTRDYLPDRAVVVGRGNDYSLNAELVGKRVVLQDGYADIEAVERIYPKSQIILAPTLYSAMEALEHGDADALIINELIARSYLDPRPYLGLEIRFESLLPATGFAFALRGDDTKLLKLFDRSLADLGEPVARQILGRWMIGSQAQIDSRRIRLSQDEQDWIRRHRQVTVASTLHRPYIYKDERGEWVGLNIDLLNRISRMTGLSFVHEEMPSTQAALETLSAGQADMNSTLAENTARRQFLNFSHAYGGHSWVFVIAADHDSPVNLAQLSGKVLALPTGHALLEYLRARHPDIQLRLVPTYQEARALVERGEAQATIQNEVGAAMSVPGGLKIGNSVEGRWSPDRIAVVQGQPELLSILNKALLEFPVDEMRAIRLKWLSAVMPQAPVWQRIPQWVYWVLAVVVLLGVVSLVWSSRLKIQVQQRMRAEAQLNDQLAFQRALFEGIPNPVCVRDLTGRLISCNPGYEKSVGVSFEQMNGRRLIDIDLIPRGVAKELHDEYMSVVRNQQPLSVDRSMELGGQRVETRHWIVPFYGADGQLQGLLGGWTDITGCRRLESEQAG